MKKNFLCLLLQSISLFGYELKEHIKELSSTSQEISLTFTLKKNEYLYKDSLIPSVDSSEVTLSAIKTTQGAVTFFDDSYKKDKEGYTGTVTFTIRATIKQDAQQPKAVVHTHFMLNTDKKPHEKTIALLFALPQKVGANTRNASGMKNIATASAPQQSKPKTSSFLGALIRKVLSAISATIVHAQVTLTALFTNSGSRVLRLLAVFLLGIMLSLTPCIYPMIPITVGVLQASGTKSGLQNFLLALSYTLGISVTFALFGLVASLGTFVFGELQGSPYIVLPLSALLIYFGLVMFDIVQMPIPTWLQSKNAKVTGGSKRSAFIFGAISGTVASPCLSPGLILILNYVAHLTSVSITGYIEGFLLLFIFGIGSSLPLLIIGTFSGSLALLPKAGAWMVEVKKLLGIMLISMALYHLSYLERIVPWYLFIWIAVATFIALGVYYFMTIQPYDSRWLRRYKNCIGTLLIVTACIIAAQGQKTIIQKFIAGEEHVESQAMWHHDYTEAKRRAINDKQLLFIDVGATYCAACKTLDTRIFKQEALQAPLSKMTLLKIDADIHVESYEQIKSVFGKEIVGYPTYLLVDPTRDLVIKKWSIDIDDLKLEQIVEAFEKLIDSFDTSKR